MLAGAVALNILAMIVHTVSLCRHGCTLASSAARIATCHAQCARITASLIKGTKLDAVWPYLRPLGWRQAMKFFGSRYAEVVRSAGSAALARQAASNLGAMQVR